jgi:hypothetical protein
MLTLVSILLIVITVFSCHLAANLERIIMKKSLLILSVTTVSYSAVAALSPFQEKRPIDLDWNKKYSNTC